MNEPSYEPHWIDAPEVSCVHVACVGLPCQYQPPAIGPGLPDVITASDGTVWRRGREWSLVWTHCTPEGGYEFATWSTICDPEAGERMRAIGHNPFPAGAWTVVR